VCDRERERHTGHHTCRCALICQYYTCHIRFFATTSFTVLVLLTAICTSQSLLKRSGHVFWKRVLSETSTRYSLYHASSLHCSALSHTNDKSFGGIFHFSLRGRKCRQKVLTERQYSQISNRTTRQRRQSHTIFNTIFKTQSNTMQISIYS
jgi:hypothetical protein